MKDSLFLAIVAVVVRREQTTFIDTIQHSADDAIPTEFGDSPIHDGEWSHPSPNDEYRSLCDPAEQLGIG